MAKLHNQNKQGSTSVIIPKEYMTRLKWAHGDRVIIDMNLKNKSLTITKEIEK